MSEVQPAAADGVLGTGNGKDGDGLGDDALSW